MAFIPLPGTTSRPDIDRSIAAVMALSDVGEVAVNALLSCNQQAVLVHPDGPTAACRAFLLDLAGSRTESLRKFVFRNRRHPNMFRGALEALEEVSHTGRLVETPPPTSRFQGAEPTPHLMLTGILALPGDPSYAARVMVLSVQLLEQENEANEGPAFAALTGHLAGLSDAEMAIAIDLFRGRSRALTRYPSAFGRALADPRVRAYQPLRGGFIQAAQGKAELTRAYVRGARSEPDLVRYALDAWFDRAFNRNAGVVAAALAGLDEAVRLGVAPADPAWWADICAHEAGEVRQAVFPLFATLPDGTIKPEAVAPAPSPFKPRYS